MRARATVVALLALARCTHAQFGNIRVQWNAAGQANVVDDKSLPPSAPVEHYANLNGLSIEELFQILTGLSLVCEACRTEGHLISRIRAGVFEMPLKALKARRY